MQKAGSMSLRSLRALCLTSFFIADVRDGLGPFLGIFLTERHWTPDDIGILMTAGAGGITGNAAGGIYYGYLPQ